MKKLFRILSLVLAINIVATSQSSAFLGSRMLGSVTGWTSSWFCNNAHVSTATNTELTTQLLKNFYAFAKNSPEQAQKLLIQAQKLISHSNINWKNSPKLAIKVTGFAIELMKKNPKITFYTALILIFIAIAKNELIVIVDSTTNLTKQTIILGTKIAGGTTKLGIKITSLPVTIPYNIIAWIFSKKEE